MAKADSAGVCSLSLEGRKQGLVVVVVVEMGRLLIGHVSLVLILGI